MSQRGHMKLGMFYWPTGHHLAAWRHPDGVPDCGGNIEHIAGLAKLAEAGLFDMFFMADSVTFWRGELEAMTRDAYGAWIEPFSLMVALSQHTKHLGLACTSTTTYDQPYALARRFASLDLASGGRAAWNLVTSGNRAEAQSFGAPDHMEKANRYARAREFAHVVRGLWNSWEDGAFVRDKASGLYHDPAHMRILEHSGEFFRARGPLNVPPSPQGEPVLVQAGASPTGRELAAESAEVVFTAQMTLEDAQEFYGDVKRRMRAWGRDPDSLKIMPGLFVCVGRTVGEAREKFELLQNLIDPRIGLQLLSKRMEFDLTGCDPDGPLPPIPRTSMSSSRTDVFENLARRENLTIRDLWRRVAGARGHYQIVGTPGEIVDMMQEWFENGACDGFNVMPPVFPGSLVDFNELVVPELQRRGLYRRAYEGTTLRENLGLKRPPWPSGAAAKAQQQLEPAGRV